MYYTALSLSFGLISILLTLLEPYAKANPFNRLATPTLIHTSIGCITGGNPAVGLAMATDLGRGESQSKNQSWWTRLRNGKRSPGAYQLADLEISEDEKRRRRFEEYMTRTERERMLSEYTVSSDITKVGDYDGWKGEFGEASDPWDPATQLDWGQGHKGSHGKDRQLEMNSDSEREQLLSSEGGRTNNHATVGP
ncbi:hypothetical protein EDD18DRAFT_1348854 [Armillaria luteobubalina]|uniref:Uncharacterized protein n=1 Tax=Armillaria luteobubalina TaxID=153913 RepID=A0AA39TT96_9AGAR|nr:hypothetical protein EDD18DRAFT_1348854 [Armillaria luteobubalina]